MGIIERRLEGDRTPPSAEELLGAAKVYAARGWPVLPLHGFLGNRLPDGDFAGQCTCGNARCHSPGMHLRVDGLEEATCDTARLERWWREWPDANVGIATGSGSRLIVLDRWETVPDLPATLVVQTGDKSNPRGAFYFAHPGGALPSHMIAEGLRLVGDGDYVVAPPSFGSAGLRWSWLPFPEETPELAEVQASGGRVWIPSTARLAPVPATLLGPGRGRKCLDS